MQTIGESNNYKTLTAKAENLTILMLNEARVLLKMKLLNMIHAHLG